MVDVSNPFSVADLLTIVTEAQVARREWGLDDALVAFVAFYGERDEITLKGTPALDFTPMGGLVLGILGGVIGAKQNICPGEMVVRDARGDSVLWLASAIDGDPFAAWEEGSGGLTMVQTEYPDFMYAFWTGVAQGWIRQKGGKNGRGRFLSA